jgi:hypothetical protein
MTNVNKTTIIQVRTGEVENQMVQELCKKLGSRPPELIRGLIRDKHTKMFPAYTPQARMQAIERIPDEELTPEQICEKAGGRIGTNGAGDRVCILSNPKNPNSQSSVLLSRPDTIMAAAKKYKSI